MSRGQSSLPYNAYGSLVNVLQDSQLVFGCRVVVHRLNVPYFRPPQEVSSSSSRLVTRSESISVQHRVFLSILLRQNFNVPKGVFMWA